MPWNLFKSDEGDGYGNHSDDGVEQELNRAKSIRTTPLIKEFVKVSDRQLEQEQKRLQQRKDDQKRFEKLLEIRAEWEKQDTAATVSLFKYLSEVHQQLTQKRLAPQALAIVQEQSRLAQAKAAQQVEDTRSKIDAAIANLQKQRSDIADRQGWRQ